MYFFLPIHQCFCRLDTSLIMNLMFQKVHLIVLILTIFPVKMVLCFCLVCKQFELLFPSTFPSCRCFSHLDSMDVRHLSVCLIIIWQLFGQANSTHVHSSNSFRRIFLHIFFFSLDQTFITHSITIFSNSNYLFRYDNIKRIVFFFTRFIRQFIVPWNFYAKWNSLQMITYTSGHKIHYIMLLHGENKLLKWTTENEMAINGQ